MSSTTACLSVSLSQSPPIVFSLFLATSAIFIIIINLLHPININILCVCDQPTRLDRGWLVMPFGKNPWWWYVASFVPALLVTILIFMDQQISAVIVNRKENKLKVYIETKGLY